jgi:two-component system cell cycle sensor histidine kinase/response regulator CckA
VPDQSRSDPSPALIKASFDGARGGIVAVDFDGHVVTHNRQYLRLFCLTEDQLAGNASPEYIGLVEALLPEVENLDEIAARSGDIWAYPEREALDILRFRDGRVYERFVSPFRVGGSISGVVASFYDVTRAAITEEALQQHRAFLEKAQEVGHIGSWAAEFGGSDVLGWSKEACRIFGYGEGEFPGTTTAFLEQVHPADRDAVRGASDAALNENRPFDIEHRIVRRDGSVRWVHEKADVVRDASSRVVRMIGTVQDITDRRLLEDQLRQSQKMEAIGRLVGGIAHDLNNALTAIAGYSELAIGQLGAGHPARIDVEEVRRGAERAGSVTRQLLAFSRKEILAPRLFDLNQTISTLGRLLSRLLGTDIDVRTELAPSVPPILGDPGQFEQAIINLAVNARDAMPNGGRLVLSTRVEDYDEAAARANPPMTPGRYIVLRVSDTGQGMSRETLAHIFEPFFTTKSPGRGTGLGLSMVYGTLKQIGGFIFADSEPDRGATFRLYFRPAAAEHPTSQSATVDAADARIRRTVLVVEDEPAVRNSVASTLRTDGYRLLIAGSAEEALQLAADHHEAIDLLVTDAILPGKTGIELARLLTAQRPNLQVIVMTGYRQDTVAGFDESVNLLQKPFAPKELRDRIRNALVHVRENSR